MIAPELRLFTEPNEDMPDDAIDVWMDGEIIGTFNNYEVGTKAVRDIERLIETISRQL